MDVTLVFNKAPHSVPVTLGNGKRIQMSIYPNEALVDGNGNVHALVMTFNDGRVSNFQLLPKKERHLIPDLVADFLIPFGLGVAGGKLFRFKDAAGRQKELVNNVLTFIFSSGMTATIKNLLNEYTPAHLSYIAMDTHEEVITHPIRLTQETMVKTR